MNHAVVIVTVWQTLLIIKFVIHSIFFTYLFPKYYADIKKKRPNRKMTKTYFKFIRVAYLKQTGDFVADYHKSTTTCKICNLGITKYQACIVLRCGEGHSFHPKCLFNQ